MENNTQRFSNRVDNYVKYRPGYPAAILPWLEQATGFRKATIVADIGAGTGIITDMFLQHGNTVYAVEPNAACATKPQHYCSTIKIL